TEWHHRFCWELLATSSLFLRGPVSRNGIPSPPSGFSGARPPARRKQRAASQQHLLAKVPRAASPPTRPLNHLVQEQASCSRVHSPVRTAFGREASGVVPTPRVAERTRAHVYRRSGNRIRGRG